jgi:hypothetical protein
MNDRKLKKLFELSRAEHAPEPPAGFDARVLDAIRQETRLGPPSLWDQLGALLPRLAAAAALVITLCVASDYYFSGGNSGSLTADVSELSEQWLFASGN